MKAADDKTREELRDRFLEVSLEEVLARKGGSDSLDLEIPKRPAWWILPLTAAILLIAVVPFLRRETAEEQPAAGLSATCEGVVLLPGGEPAAGAQIRFELGFREGDTLSSGGTLSVANVCTSTNDSGHFTIQNLPPGSEGMVFASSQQQYYAKVRAAPKMKIILEPAGGLTGRVVGDMNPDRQLRVQVSAPGWSPLELSGSLWCVPTTDGEFKAKGLPPGPATLVITRLNWPLLKVPVTVVSGQEVAVPAIELADDASPLPSLPGPLVQADKVRLINAEGGPMPGLIFCFSLPNCSWMLRSNETGEVVLAHGRREPPFLLSLHRIGGAWIDQTPPTPVYSGSLEVVRDRVAIVRLTPLRTVLGEVRIGDRRLREHRVMFTPKETPEQTIFGPSIDGRYSLQVPPGPGTLILLSPDGKLRRQEIDVPPGKEPLAHDIEFTE